MKCYWFCIFDKENPNDNKKNLNHGCWTSIHVFAYVYSLCCLNIVVHFNWEVPFTKMKYCKNYGEKLDYIVFTNLP